MTITTDPNDPRLVHDPDEGIVTQAEAYLVLPNAERKSFIRALRYSYWHTTCGEITSMSDAIAETIAHNPRFYDSMYCATCHMHRPIGPDGEFYWVNRFNILQRDTTRDARVGT